MAQDNSDSEIVRLVNRILLDAINAKTSDVHIATDENDISIRFRVDGVLQIQTVPPEIKQAQSNVIARLKIMANLDIAERRLPQDGRIKIQAQGRDIDIRVSCIPTLDGEGIVMRILDRGSITFSLRGLGMEPTIYERINQLIHLPHGLILVTGPTGSGKSTTLYSALTAINQPGIKIVTAEDPVEYKLSGISQIQVNEKIGLNFSSILRRILRHDPDVVLVGEIRDFDTVEIALQAAMTGHLVFSTLHTNDSAGAYTRLLSQGVEPYLVSSCIDAVIAQRLVRNLCEKCKEPYRPQGAELPKDFPMDALKADPALANILKPGAAGTGVIFKAKGCPVCRNTGYKGRSGIYELLLATDKVRELADRRATSSEIKQAAIEGGMKTLRQDAWRKVLSGDTTVEEVLRVTKHDLV